ncbi:MAG TPA: tRNA preQ1(34) S-adenosylmethionine ribosyltransferase-isomerase QueA [Polyangiaceae bacterium]|nr:tRNA preQ1(34) S-adenosylmethionine ribosyltransferase-isomerase QueA [Polyangiaceae bacterium]
MRTDLFDYALPAERIAQRPTTERDGARLLVLDRGAVTHRAIKDWPELVPSGSLVVLNDSRVLKARLECRKAGGGSTGSTSSPRAGLTTGGGKVELLFLRPERVADGREVWQALGRANRPLREGTELEVADAKLKVVGKVEQGVLLVEVTHEAGVMDLLQRVGHVPLPPYVERADDAADVERYQTVFAQHDGSVAAPTAGLHLTEELLNQLQRRDVQVARVTLHVGVGTFRPVSVDDLDQHPMHEELIDVSSEVVERISATRASGKPVVAVGTTVVRALESAAASGSLQATRGPTRLLIQPGYQFRVVDALLTNFHAPRSTLLALVSAFAGVDAIRAAYKLALADSYRFLSYGDAMWLPRRSPSEGTTP